MRRRPSARLFVFDEAGRVLLFRYALHLNQKEGSSDWTYWSTPGGAVEPGESFEEAARRELWEETGIKVLEVGTHVAEREFELDLVTGEKVIAEERYFAVRVAQQALSYASWTELEKQFMLEHRWWLVEDLRATTETVFPEKLVEMLKEPQ